jgi:predicted ribosome quality control (RQC) complex YloA/Tae2 family protein
MRPEVEIDLLKHQIHEMEQDIENYLERMERYQQALEDVVANYGKIPPLGLLEIVQEALRS